MKLQWMDIKILIKYLDNTMLRGAAKPLTVLKQDGDFADTKKVSAPFEICWTAKVVQSLTKK
jgi:hypothetical protein